MVKRNCGQVFIFYYFKSFNQKVLYNTILNICFQHIARQGVALILKVGHFTELMQDES